MVAAIFVRRGSHSGSLVFVASIRVLILRCSDFGDVDFGDGFRGRWQIAQVADSMRALHVAIGLHSPATRLDEEARRWSGSAVRPTGG